MGFKKFAALAIAFYVVKGLIVSVVLLWLFLS